VSKRVITSHLKIKILVQNAANRPEFQPAGMLQYGEDLKEGVNTEFGPKYYYEMACRNQGQALACG
jgi:hypothetical protein